MLLASGHQITIDTDRDYTDPFILPIDGYVCETVRGMPKPLSSYVERLVAAGRCNKCVHNFIFQAYVIELLCNKECLVRGWFILRTIKLWYV